MKKSSKLRFIADGADEAASVALHDTAAFILTLIRQYVHVQTGWLRDSYQKETLEQLHILIGTMVFYAVYEEFGSRNRPPHPHFTPAWNQGNDFFRQQLIKRIKDLG